MDREDPDYDFWEQHPDPSDQDIAELARAWVAYERESRERKQRNPTPPPGPDDVVVAEGPGWRIHRSEQAEADDLTAEPGWWAAEAVMNSHRGGLPLQWRVILALCVAVDPADEWVVMMIGVGPIETMLMDHGEAAMDLIEPAADQDPVLREALTSIWLFDEPVRPRLDRYLGIDRSE